MPVRKGKALGPQERSPANPKSDWWDRGNRQATRCRGVEAGQTGAQANSGQGQAVSGVKLPWRLPTPKCQQRQAAIPSFSRFANDFELLISQLVNTVGSGVSVYSFSRHLHSHPPSLLVFTLSSLVRWWMVCWLSSSLANCLSCPACRHCCTSPIFTISVARFCLRSASLRLSDQFLAVVSYQK